MPRQVSNDVSIKIFSIYAWNICKQTKDTVIFLIHHICIFSKGQYLICWNKLAQSFYHIDSLIHNFCCHMSVDTRHKFSQIPAINRCKGKKIKCGKNAKCNKGPGRKCRCKSGYRGNPFTLCKSEYLPSSQPEIEFLSKCHHQEVPYVAYNTCNAELQSEGDSLTCDFTMAFIQDTVKTN